MKRVLLLFCSIFYCALSYAGDEIILKSGNPKVLYESVEATLEIDYSETMVKTETLNEYLNRRGADFVKDWPEDSQKAKEFFIVRFNKKNKNGMQIIETVGQSAPYKIVLHVSYLDMGNGGSSFVPWASAKAGGVIMNGTLDIIDVENKAIVCTMSAEEVKGVGHPSETIRLGACYFELASRMLKYAKSYKETGNETNKSYTESNTQSSVTATQQQAVIIQGNSETEQTSASTTTKQERELKDAVIENTSIGKTNPVSDETSSVNNKTVILTKAKGEEIPRRRKPIVGDFEKIAEEKTIGVYLDFTDAEIMGRSEESFIRYMKTSAGGRDLDKDFPNTWSNDIKPELLSMFCAKVNNTLKDKDLRLRLSEELDSDYVLKLDVLEVDDDGNNIIDFLFVNMSTGQVEAQIKCESKGGHVGRFVGLIEQGFESAAKNFVKTLISQID